MRWLEFVGLADKADDLAEALSYGQQKLRVKSAGARARRWQIQNRTER